MEQVREEGDGLHCFAETHLIGQNTVLAVTPEVGEPVETGHLEVFQCAALPDVFGLFGHADVGRSPSAECLAAWGHCDRRSARKVRIDLVLRNGRDISFGFP